MRCRRGLIRLAKAKPEALAEANSELASSTAYMDADFRSAVAIALLYCDVAGCRFS
jgi:hypothetical protein